MYVSFFQQNVFNEAFYDQFDCFQLWNLRTVGIELNVERFIYSLTERTF